MECQRAPLQLTDQALVAVEIARRLAATPNAAHLLAGLAAEPDGVAGALLANPPRAAHALVSRALPHDLPALDAVLRRAVGGAGMPLWTLDLLRAALTAEGLDDVLEGAGYDPGGMRRLLALPEWRGGPSWLLAARALGELEPDPETRGLPVAGSGRLSAAAALALARARALRGTARDVALALQAAEERGWPLPDLLAALQLAREHGSREATADDVLAATGDAPVDCGALARAALRVLVG